MPSFQLTQFRVSLRFLEEAVLKPHMYFILWGSPLFGHTECNEVMIIGS